MSSRGTAVHVSQPGRPCLIPVRLDTATRVQPGLITRLDSRDAWITLEEPFEGDREVFAFFKRPDAGHHVGVRGRVTRIDADGGLWRGHPAVHVQFAMAVRRAPAAEDSVEFSLDSIDDTIQELPRLPRARTPERVLSDVPVQFVLDGRTHGGHASNFSETGLFVTTRVLARGGQRVHVHFPIPTREGETIGVEIDGAVRWLPDTEGQRQGLAGFGLSITSFPHTSDGALYGAFVRQLTGGTPQD